MAIDIGVIVPVREIDPRIAPNVTIIEDWISERVGMFFSTNDSIPTKYKITICENGRTTEGFPSIKKSKEKYPIVRHAFPNPAARWYFISSFRTNLILSKDGSIIIEPRFFPFFTGIDKIIIIRNEIIIPIKKQDNPKAKTSGI